MTHRQKKLCALLTLIGILLLSGCSAKKAATFHPAEGSAVATLCAVGDIMISPQQLEAAAQPDGSYSFTDGYLGAAELLADADLTVGNLEGTLNGAPYDSYNYPDALAACLSGLGFDVLQTANSRSIQNGIAGLTRTKEQLEAVGIDALGTFASEAQWQETGGVLIREVNGIRIALIGMTKGLNNMRLPENAGHCVNLLYTDYDSNYSSIDTDAITRLTKNAEAENPDITIAMVHWGSENERTISESQKQIASLLIDGGVDVILGSHSHLVGPIEQRTVRGRPVVIAYGLGDFSGSAEDREAIALRLAITKDSKTGETRVTEVSYTPLYVTQSRVYDIETALSLYESNYIDAISEEQQKVFTAALERLKEQTAPPES